MTSHVKNPHTPEQMRALSNAGHLIEGSIISGSALALLAGELAGDDKGQKWAASLMAGAGGLLALGLVGGSLDHGGPIEFFRADHQQRQHLVMASLLTVGGAARYRGRWGRLASAAASARIGQMFLTHEQHGTDEAAVIARERHVRLGWTIVAASAVGALGDLLKSKSLRSVGAALLLTAGIQLVTYREPEQAYEETHSSKHFEHDEIESR